MDKLVSFQINDSFKLFELTKKLHEAKFFKDFLNETQLKLFDYLIRLNNHSVWNNFLGGTLYLKVSKDSKLADNDPESIGIEEEEVDVQEGIETSKRLALHVRYLLYEKAIDFYYFNKNLDESINTIDEVNDDYALLESLNRDSPDDQNDAVQEKEEIKSTVREEDDEYDDEDDEDSVSDGNKNDQDEVPSAAVEFNNDNQLVLEVPMSLFSKLEAASDEHQEESGNNIMEDQANLIKEFNKVYHNFEYDRETLIKRRRLEKSDLQLQTNAEPVKSNNNNQDKDSDKSSSNIEFSLATGSSLKHLLGTIQHKRDQIPLNDYELRTLFMDVKKNRGKWANDERVGQEELYEACEKVVLELRSYTEHSTPFLNKVSKREAPNYGLIIKKPMDLNTVMKKLKNLQYNSKQEFVDDIMLIWSNCLTYNSDPKHFLRAHAIAMQKKSLKLIPHVPNIIIKNRSELEKDDEKDEINDEPGKGGKGGKKGRKRTRENEVKIEHQDSTIGSPDSAFGTPMEEEKILETPLTVEQTPAPETTETSETSAAFTRTSNNGEDEEDEEDNDEENEDPANQGNQNEEDEIEPELQAWRTLTAKSRAHYCATRAELFDENDSFKLKPDAPAIFRDPIEMRNFNDYINNKVVVSKGSLLDNDEPYLLEYDIMGGLPGLKFAGIDEEEQEKRERRIVDSLIANKIEQRDSKFVLSPGNGLNSVYTKNITEMQEIRRICFKISLIRQMQTQQFIHHTQMRQPEIETIKEIDIDPISKLDTHDINNKEIQYSVLRRNISKIIMQTGFEKAEPFAVNTLTQLAERYMGNLVKSLKLHLESTSKNKLSSFEIILVSLIENGINKPDDLYTFVNERLISQYNKLVDLRAKLSNFLKELLRPGLENFNEKSFNDNSDQFMTGDFSNDLGDDFFGFKELGLDKEFNMLSSSIPVYLLHSKLHTSFISSVSGDKAHKYDDLKEYKPNKLYGSDIGDQIGLLKPFYAELLEKSKAHYIKMQKKNGLSTELPELSKLALVDDEDLPQKQRNIRPRLPPTGKIIAVKKRPVANSFFLPEPEELKPIDDNNETGAVPMEINDDPFNADELDAKDLELMMSNLEE